jgi:hypothetical protein
MSHKTIVRVMSGILMILFLCSPFISTSLNSADFGSGQGLTIIKSTGAHSFSDIQFPIEEKEGKDLTEESQDVFTEYSFTVNVFSVSKLFIPSHFSHVSSRSFGNTTNLPVYLAKKALLI